MKMMNKYQEALNSLCKKCNKNYCKQFTSYNCEAKIILQELINEHPKYEKALDKAIDLLTNYDEDKFHRIACNDKCKYREECMKADGDCLLIIRNEDKEETKRRLLEDD